MKKIVLLITGLIFLSTLEISAQQFTAINYWMMEHDGEYTRVLKKQTNGEPLSSDEQTYISDYKLKLAEYFEKLSDNEKASYFQNRKTWEQNPGFASKPNVPQEQEVYSGERSMYSQYLISSGIFGFMYGSTTAAIFEMDEGGLVALPLLSAGVATLFPIMSIKDKNVSYNSLALSLHGKSVGALQGVALSLLLSGDNIDQGKLILGLSTLSSIALGKVGYKLGREKPWSRGKVALYSHYGQMMPFEGMAIALAFESENPRVYGAASLLFGAGGYLIADRVSGWNDYTLGDVRATTTLSTMNTILGFCIVGDIGNNNDIKPSAFLIPAAGALGGTLAGHLWLKDARLSNQQGRTVALATTGGSILGMGLIAIGTPESVTPYYVAGYLAGLSVYGIMVEKYKRENKMSSSINNGEKRWDVSFMPQNILINQKIAPYAFSNPQKRVPFLPAFSASVKF